MTDAIYFFVREIGDRFISQPCPDPTVFKRRRKFSAVSKSLSIASGHTEACGIERTFAGAAGTPPGIRRRKAGTDQGTAITRSWLREFRKGSASERRGRGAARGAEATGRMPPCAIRRA